MKITAGFKNTINEVNESVIKSLVMAMPGGTDSFIILERSDMFYMQVSGSKTDGYQLEYREGADETHLVVAPDIAEPGQVIEAFVEYLNGGSAYKTSHTWKPLFPPSEKNTGCMGLLSMTIGLVAVGIYICWSLDCI